MKMKNSARVRKFLPLILAFVLLLGTALPAMADDAYYEDWNVYKESGQPCSTWVDVANAMDAVFDKGIEYFEAGDMTEAYNCVNDGYYGYYEITGFERIAMGYIAGSRKTEVELQFSACKAVCKNNGTLDEFVAEIDTLKDMIRTDAHILDGTTEEEDSSDSGDTSTSSSSSSSSGKSTTAAVAAFTACFSIILREGFEAILIIGAIIAYIKKSGYEEKKKKNNLLQVYLGCVIGIVMSFVLAWLLNELKLANSAKQEIIEGVTALLAVCVLYYVSNWMLGKSESAAWSSYIMEKADNKKNGAFAMAFTAFLAVFREGAEVVLFYQPMLATYDHANIWAGFIVGCVALVFVYIAVTQLGVRIPIRFFFTVMSLIMAVMSISFLGAGIKELIEGDVITMISPDWLQWIPSNDLMDVLGIYPTLQTLIPQIILIIVTVFMFRIRLKKNKEIRVAQEAKHAEELAKAEEERKAEEDAKLRALIREVCLEVLAEKSGESAE